MMRGSWGSPAGTPGVLTALTTLRVDVEVEHLMVMPVNWAEHCRDSSSQPVLLLTGTLGDFDASPETGSGKAVSAVRSMSGDPGLLDQFRSMLEEGLRGHGLQVTRAAPALLRLRVRTAHEAGRSHRVVWAALECHQPVGLLLDPARDSMAVVWMKEEVSWDVIEQPLWLLTMPQRVLDPFLSEFDWQRPAAAEDDQTGQPPKTPPTPETAVNFYGRGEALFLQPWRSWSAARLSRELPSPPPNQSPKSDPAVLQMDTPPPPMIEPCPSTERAWRRFTKHLAAALDDLGDGEFLILNRKGTNYFVQFAGHGACGMRVEAVSNQFLGERARLSESTLQDLLRRGWNAPTYTYATGSEEPPVGSPNFYVDAKGPVPTSALAVLAVDTLRHIYGVRHPSDLQYESSHVEGGRSIRFPLLGLARRER
jgi:hypothetical protein